MSNKNREPYCNWSENELVETLIIEMIHDEGTAERAREALEDDSEWDLIRRSSMIEDSPHTPLEVRAMAITRLSLQPDRYKRHEEPKRAPENRPREDKYVEELQDIASFIYSWEWEGSDR